MPNEVAWGAPTDEVLPVSAYDKTAPGCSNQMPLKIAKDMNVISIGRCASRRDVERWEELGTNCFWRKRTKGYREIRIVDMRAQVSRNHCAIYKAANGNYYVYDGGFEVKDGKFRRGLGHTVQWGPSKHGTRVNDRLIANPRQTGEHPLTTGDIITVGTFTFKIILP